MNAFMFRFVRSRLLVGAGLLGAGLFAGCSSSTSPSSSGSALTAPATVNFGAVKLGQVRDTTITLQNTTSSSVTITGNSVSNGNAADTNFSAPVTIAANGSKAIHLQFNPIATGGTQAVDSIHYQSGGQNYALAITIEGTVSAPGQGSSYTFDTYDSTSSGYTPHTDSTYHVVATNLTYAGKTNVIAVLKSTDTAYYHMESNGDISRYVKIQGGNYPALTSVWLTLPVASHTELSGTLPDTVVSIPYQGLNIPATVHRRGTRSIFGTRT